jgi:multidrug resistance efflux pump
MISAAAPTPLQRAASPRPLVTLAAVLAVATASLAALLATLPWQQTAVGRGAVVAFAPTDRPQRLDAPITGRVEAWLVVEGATVRAGDPIARISDIDPNYVERLRENRAAILDRVNAGAARVQAYRTQRDAFERAGKLAVTAAKLEITMARQKLAAAEQRKRAAQAALRTARQQLARVAKLAREGLASQREVELSELAEAKADTDVRGAQAAVSEARAYVTAMQAKELQADADAGAKVASAGAEAQKAETEVAYAKSELAKIETDLSRQESRLVRAPRDGTVLELAGHAGAMVVKQGERLGTLVPSEGRAAVELWIDGNDAPLVRPGRPVRLQFEGWPALQMAGWPGLAVGTFGGTIAFVDMASRQDGAFRVVVLPDPQQPPWPDRDLLRQGLRAKGWVLLDEVSLGYEVWRQFNGFPREIPDDVGAKGGAGGEQAGNAGKSAGTNGTVKP